MDSNRRKQYAQFYDHRSSKGLAVYYDSKPTRDEISNNNYSNYRNRISNRYRINLQSVKYFLVALVNVFSFFPQSVRAESVGGVSASAAPVANSSGSVTNQAIQVLQGPYITNTYGNGVSCQGPTLNITPFITGSNSWKEPYEDYWNSPVYDMTTDSDGNLNNPGSILYYVPTRTGQKANNNISLGISATVSIPLDKRHHEGCLRAATTQTQINQQVLANKRLDFEMARLKHCSEQKRLGVSFHPKSPAFQICADIVVTNPHGVIPQHQHSIISPSSSSKEVNPSSLDTDQQSSQNESDGSESSQANPESSSLQSLSEALSPSTQGQPAASLGPPMSLQLQLSK